MWSGTKKSGSSDSSSPAQTYQPDDPPSGRWRRALSGWMSERTFLAIPIFRVGSTGIGATPKRSAVRACVSSRSTTQLLSTPVTVSGAAALRVVDELGDHTDVLVDGARAELAQHGGVSDRSQGHTLTDGGVGCDRRSLRFPALVFPRCAVSRPGSARWTMRTRPPMSSPPRENPGKPQPAGRHR